MKKPSLHISLENLLDDDNEFKKINKLFDCEFLIQYANTITDSDHSIVSHIIYHDILAEWVTPEINEILDNPNETLECKTEYNLLMQAIQKVVDLMSENNIDFVTF
jgi:hypothetical protein